MVQLSPIIYHNGKPKKLAASVKTLKAIREKEKPSFEIFFVMVIFFEANF